MVCLLATRGMLSKAREMLGCNEIEQKREIKKVFICPECKKEMVVFIMIPRPAGKCNKAPPKVKDSLNNLSFNRSA